MFIKNKKLITMLTVLAMVCLLTAPALAGDGTGGGGGPSSLTFDGATYCTINGETATVGDAIENNDDVDDSTTVIELHFNHNVAATTANDNTTPVLANNKTKITLYNVTDSICVSDQDDVGRIHDGATDDPERQHLFLYTDGLLEANHTYRIEINGWINCYNTETLNQDYTVTFDAI